MIHLSAHGKRDPGPVFLFDCPACQGTAVACTTLTLHEELRAMFVVPLGTHTTRFANCTVCGEEFLCKVDFTELRGLGPADVARHLVVRVSLVDKTLALVSILFAWAPVFGVVLAFIAFRMTRDRRHWTRTCSRIGLLLSSVCSAVMLASILVENS